MGLQSIIRAIVSPFNKGKCESHTLLIEETVEEPARQVPVETDLKIGKPAEQLPEIQEPAVQDSDFMFRKYNFSVRPEKIHMVDEFVNKMRAKYPLTILKGKSNQCNWLKSSLITIKGYSTSELFDDACQDVRGKFLYDAEIKMPEEVPEKAPVDVTEMVTFNNDCFEDDVANLVADIKLNGTRWGDVE